MTTAQNNVSVPAAATITAPKTGSVAVNQGDLVKVTSNLVLPIAGTTNAPIGMSEDTSPVASLGDLLTQIIVQLKKPYAGCNIAFLPVATGITVNFFDSCYLTADAQIVTNSSAGGATRIGRFVVTSAFLGDDSKRAAVLLCGNN